MENADVPMDVIPSGTEISDISHKLKALDGIVVRLFDKVIDLMPEQELNTLDPRVVIESGSVIVERE